MNTLSRALGALVCAGIALSLSAAAPPDPETPEATYTESAGAEYVMLPVVVLDKKGRFVEDLKKEDFRVRVQETAVDPDTFERDDGAPVSFAFLVDTSGSMEIGGKLDNAKSAIRDIVRQRHYGDDFALFAFAEKEVRLVSDFEAGAEKLLSALSGLEASGQTALFDAVAATPRLMKGKNSKRAILLFTDGVDNASRLESVEMAEILQQVSTPIYTIGMKNAAYDLLTEEQRRELMVDNLKMLASSSGGRMFLLSGRSEELRPIVGQIEQEVRRQYLLGFSPSGDGNVEYRIVFVSVVKPGQWTIRTRRGYRGTAPVPAASLKTKA